ncbi:MAG: Antibiotic biosynthesis monooxygenase [Phycisphaerales bacterium]|nr:Antibiotic biosynthesis monooxygenase [Phycisphaerales bacterium]
MTTVGMHYDVLPGKEQTFVDAFLKVIDVLGTTPGHVESRLFEDVARRGSYLIISRWERKEDFGAFVRSDAFKAVVTWGKEEVLRGRPEHKIYADA